MKWILSVTLVSTSENLNAGSQQAMHMVTKGPFVPRDGMLLLIGERVHTVKWAVWDHDRGHLQIELKESNVPDLEFYVRRYMRSGWKDTKWGSTE